MQKTNPSVYKQRYPLSIYRRSAIVTQYTPKNLSPFQVSLNKKRDIQKINQNEAIERQKIYNYNQRRSTKLHPSVFNASTIRFGIEAPELTESDVLIDISPQFPLYTAPQKLQLNDILSNMILGGRPQAPQEKCSCSPAIMQFLRKPKGKVQ
ncbi:hypothetical protein SS50377_28254 [Spironucleus salmonicida]|uniref:Uncharacterized protein n=1 Tax=Spironucleus salmonicida TaxID=348837 RepID=V6LW07_9EUKA|nr:hypothetical protein SS50377_28254 [Spironucleus salmonicida]|eukprot:EST48433.1 Hypothetical protein SS50377_11383 [Spironucleus salmonicida]